jgi:hypothetical protein
MGGLVPGSVWRGVMSALDPYAQVETMRRYDEVDHAGPYGAECLRPT